MAEVVVDQKPVPLPPVDPNVRIPESVARRAAAVEALYAGQPSGPESAPPAPDVPKATGAPPQDGSHGTVPSPAEPIQATAPPPERPPPSPQDDGLTQAERDWRRDYLAMQGRYNAAQRTITEMQEQMQQLGDELLQRQPAQPQPPQHRLPSSPPLITQADVQNYGTDLLDFTQRAAIQAVQPRLAYLQDENEELKARLAREARVRLDGQVEASVPNWREVDSNPRWHQWLRLPDFYTGRIRQELLNEAIAAASGPRVVSMFRGFLAEEHATGNSTPVTSPAPSPAPPPREPVFPLPSLAAPGRARPAPGGETSVPADAPYYTRAQIREHYRNHQRGAWNGREADWQRLEQDMIRAGPEGRVRDMLPLDGRTR